MHNIKLKNAAIMFRNFEAFIFIILHAVCKDKNEYWGASKCSFSANLDKNDRFSSYERIKLIQSQQ